MHTKFITTTRGLDRESQPMKLFEKAKKFGIWNPSDFDFTQDIADWQRLTDPERDLLLRLTAMFQAGEEAVTLDLLPLIMVIASEGRLEEEMFLTTFLWEEAKHTDFFHRFLSEVAGVSTDLSHYHTPAYHELFYQALPSALNRLKHDPSPKAQVQASVTYNLVVEGMLAETGYHAYFEVLERNDLLPATRRGIQLLKQDESRHIAYGIHLLSRLVSEHEGLWEVVEETFNELVMPALSTIGEAFALYDPMPFGLVEEHFTDYALDQLQKRITIIEKAAKI